MKILAVVNDAAWFQYNILDTLRKHYCEKLVTFLCPGIGLLWSKTWRDKRDQLNRDLINLVRDLKRTSGLDLILFNIYDDFLLVDTARQLQREGIPMVNYHVDMVGQWYRNIRTAPYLDAMLSAHHQNVDQMQRYCRRVIMMPMAANPDFYTRLSEKVTGYQHTVSFIGSHMAFRQAILLRMLAQDIPVDIYGGYWRNEGPRRSGLSVYKIAYDLWYYGWPRFRADGIESLLGPFRRRFLSNTRQMPDLPERVLCGRSEDEQMPMIFRGSQINLGFSDYGWSSSENLSRSRKVQLRLRDYEVPMSGGFYLAQYTPEHAEYYQAGEEIETWQSVEELIDKSRYYLDHLELAEKIRARGLQRALRDHTWRNRFDAVFSQLQLEGVLKST
jgi:spore maturation protein CgeB